MPQVTNWTIPNSGGSTFRATLNTTLLALQSTSSGPTTPTPTVAGMMWFDTTNLVLKRRNNANNAWLEIHADTMAANTLRGSLSGGAESDLSKNDLLTILATATSLSSNSYYVAPGFVGTRLCVQWGTASVTTSGVTVTFPLTFAGGVRVLATGLTTGIASVTHQNPSNSSVLIQARDFAGAQIVVSADWLAVGFV